MGRSVKGFALLTVILVLAALVALATPFLLSMRNEYRGSAARAESTRARIAAVGVREHARRLLEESHPSRDTSPLFDDSEEFKTDLNFPKEFFDAADSRGEIWSAQATDEQGKLNINSARPFVFARLFGSTWVNKDVSPEDTEIPVDSTAGFEPKGFLWIHGELIHYQGLNAKAFRDCTRGVLSETNRFLKPQNLKKGRAVLDDRVHAFARWRIDGGKRFREYENVTSLSLAGEKSIAGAIPSHWVEAFEPLLTVYSRRGGAPAWAAPVRVERVVEQENSKTLLVSNSRYFGEGTTVKITGKDDKIEYGIVLEGNASNSRVVLESPLLNSYESFEAEISALIPHPVNINSARAELIKLLFHDLQKGANTSSKELSSSDADLLAARLIQSRPIQGFEDLFKRVLKPLVKEQGWDFGLTQNVYRNALNSNDAELFFASMPLTFRGSDVYQLDSATSMNTPAGSERARTILREVISVAPQETLMSLILDQSSFEESFRLTREARHWWTGPHNQSFFDGRNIPPASDLAQLTLEDEKLAFPAKDPVLAFAASAPSRKELPNGRFEHFDHEREYEGRSLSQGAWKHDPSSAPVSLTAATQRLFPGAIEAWFKPKAWNGGFIDLGGNSLEQNRVSLFVEGTDLVLRVFDEAGDDPDTVNIEAGEIRYPTSELVKDTWTHLSAFWHGTRPSDNLLMVDGVKRGETRYFTRLAADLSSFQPNAFTVNAAQIPVESTDGFPDSGVIRIAGKEIIEYSSKSQSAFNATWITSGKPEQAWIGGRMSRLGADAAQNIVSTMKNSKYSSKHSKGDGVELYGYSAPLQSNIPPGGVKMGALGRFSVAKLARVTPPANGDPISFQVFPLGYGLEKENGSPRPWILETADGDPDFMKAFSTQGGFALVFQRVEIDTDTNARTGNNTPLFGVELVHYRGVNNNTLLIDQRAVKGSQKLTPGSVDDFDGNQRAFITKFNSGARDYNADPCYWVYVLPLSIAAPGLSALMYQSNPQDRTLSDIVQIYDPNDESKTEWVRYDEVLNGALLRSEPEAIQAALNSINIASFDATFTRAGNTACPVSGNTARSSQPKPNTIGVREISESASSIVARISDALKHRGVLGTFSHEHSSGADLIPVFQIPRNNSALAPRPGRNDRVAVFEASSGNSVATPNWRTINWTYYPDNSDNIANSETRIDINRVYIALKEQIGTPVTSNYSAQTNISLESRDYARIVKFPSGELGSGIYELNIGSSNAGVVEGEIDELEFVTGTAPGKANQDISLARYLLGADVSDAASTLILDPVNLGFSHGEIGLSNSALPELQQKRAGLLKIDDEILAFIDVDSSSGAVTIATNGRGLLNSEASSHGKGAAVVFLDHLRCGELVGELSATSAELALEDTSVFPGSGLVFLDRELIHFTNNNASKLGMPTRKIEEPKQNQKEKEEGVFRGRFGTTPAGHSDGSVVISFPFRYWDLYAPRSNAAELSYLGTHLQATGGFYQSLFWEEDPQTRDSSVEIVALARVDDWARWEDDPTKTSSLFFFDRPVLEGSLNRLDISGNRLSLRFFTRYRPGAFDPVDFRASAWKKAPRLKRVVVEYQAPNRVLWSSEGRW